MPRVPVSQGPQLRSSPLEGGFQRAPDSAAPFGAIRGRQQEALGAAALQASDQVNQVMERRAVEGAFEIENRVAEAFLQKRNELIQQRQLKNADGVARDVEEWWNSDAQKIVGEVDPMTSRALQRSLLRRREQALAEFFKFENDQKDKVGEIEYETLQTREARDAVGFIVGGNDAEAAVSLRKMEGAAREYLTRRGVPADAIEGELRKRNEKINGDVMAGLLQSDPRRAKEYFAKPGVAESFSRTARAEIESRIKLLVDAQDGAKAARDVVAEGLKGKGVHDAFDYSGAEEKLTKQFDDNPEALKAARMELDRAAALHKRNQAEVQSAGVDGAYDMLNKGSSLRVIAASPAWLQMSPQQRNAFTAQQEARYRAARNDDIQYRNEVLVREEMRTSEATLTYSDPQNLSKLSINELRALRPELGERNFAKLSKAWQDYQGNQVKLSNATFDNDMFNEVMLSSGLDPKPKAGNKEAAAVVVRARDMIDANIAREQLAKGRELTGPEKRTAAQQAMAQRVLVKGSIYGATEMPLVAVGQDDMAKAFVKVDTVNAKGVATKRNVKLSDIPASEYQQVESSLRRRGRATGPQEVATEWFNIKQQLAPAQ